MTYRKLDKITDISDACRIAAYIYANNVCTGIEIKKALKMTECKIYRFANILLKEELISVIKGRKGGYLCKDNLTAWNILTKCFEFDKKDPILLCLKQELKQLTLKDIAQHGKYYDCFRR